MKDRLTTIAADAMSYVQQLGVSAAELSVSISDGFDVTVRMGEVEKIEYQNDHAFSITVYQDGKKGSASTTNFAKANIYKVIEAAKQIAVVTTADPFAGLADKDMMATTEVDLDNVHPWDIDPEQAIELAKECESYGLNYDKKVTNSDGVSVSSHHAAAVYANTHGFIGEMQGTKHDVACVLLAEDQQKMECDYYYDHKRDANDLLPLKVIAEKAASNVVNKLNPRKLQTCKAPVLFVPELARGLMRQFISSISGAQIYRNASFMVDHLGKPVFADNINIYEKPLLPKANGRAWFDSDGVATRENHFVTNGVLQSYCLGSYSARRLNMQTTGNADGVHNLIVEPTAGDFNDLLKKLDNGLLVTDLLGHGGNMVTGDYSSGAAGYWVENGQIQFPVAEITIAANMKDLFLNTVAIGDDVDLRGNVRTGSILFEQMTIAGS